MSQNSYKSARRSALAPLESWFHSETKPAPRPSHHKTPASKPYSLFREFGLPPRPKKFDRVGFALSLLRAGAEIEHSLAVQYLYAAYSISETSSVRGNITAIAWKRDLRLVAREEMAHLVTVQNLLRALGAEPHLNRGPLHRNEHKLPLPFKLERLNKVSLGKFVLFESPGSNQILEDDMAEVEKIHKSLGNKFLRVGSIYAALYWLFMENEEPGPDWPFAPEDVSEFKEQYPRKYHLKKKDFVSVKKYTDKAATAKEWGIFESTTHVDGGSPRESALASLRWIMSQGEGPNAIEDSHFNRLLKMYREFKKTRARSLIMNVPDNPRIKGFEGGGETGKEEGELIANPKSERWGVQFNLRYQFMLLDILDSLNQSQRNMTKKRLMLARWSREEMEFVKKIGQMLPRMFLGRKAKQRAGAPFQTVFLPETPVKRDRVRKQLLEASSKCLAVLRNGRWAISTYTKDLPVAAIESSLLDAIARQDDEMRHALES
jgi:hypothetical protein